MNKHRKYCSRLGEGQIQYSKPKRDGKMQQAPEEKQNK